MDIQSIVGQFLGSVAENPEKIEQFEEAPKETVQETLGFKIPTDQLDEVIATISSLIQGKGLDMAAVMKVAGGFFQGSGDGKGDNSNILDTLTGLFGGEPDGDDNNTDSKDKSSPLDFIGDIAGGILGKK